MKKLERKKNKKKKLKMTIKKKGYYVFPTSHTLYMLFPETTFLPIKKFNNIKKS